MIGTDWPSIRERVRSRTVIATVVAVVGASLAIAIVVRLPLWSTTSEVRLSSINGRLVGELVGRIKSVELEARVIQVASGFLGLGSVPVATRPETVVRLGDKEGGFSDLREGIRVRASYELRRNVRVADSIDVLAEDAAAARTSVPRNKSVDGAATSASQRHTPPADAATLPPATGRAPVDSPRRPSAVRPTVESPRQPSAALPPVDSSRRTPAAAPPALPRPTARGPSPRTPDAVGGRSAAARAPVVADVPKQDARDTEAPDPGAVIDWLLKR